MTILECKNQGKRIFFKPRTIVAFGPIINGREGSWIQVAGSADEFFVDQDCDTVRRMMESVE